jgi:hypothetical protein
MPVTLDKVRPQIFLNVGGCLIFPKFEGSRDYSEHSIAFIGLLNHKGGLISDCPLQLIIQVDYLPIT